MVDAASAHATAPKFIAGIINSDIISAFNDAEK
jgi:hypothetical protein